MSGDRGAAGLLAIIGGMAVLAATAAAGAMVSAALIHGRVEAAADMVAIGAAGGMLTDPDPCSTADRIARDNDADLVRCEVVGLAVTVTVAAPLPPIIRSVVGAHPAKASSRAELIPGS